MVSLLGGGWSPAERRAASFGLRSCNQHRTQQVASRCIATLRKKRVGGGNRWVLPTCISAEMVLAEPGGSGGGFIVGLGGAS